MNNESPIARGEGEEFEHYVERALTTIYERQGEVESSVSGLTADVETLAQVIPEIASGLTSAHEALTKEEEALKAKEAEVSADAAELAKVKGELEQVEKAKAALDPIVSQAQSLVPAPAGGAAPGGEPGAPPAPLTP